MAPSGHQREVRLGRGWRRPRAPSRCAMPTVNTAKAHASPPLAAADAVLHQGGQQRPAPRSRPARTTTRCARRPTGAGRSVAARAAAPASRSRDWSVMVRPAGRRPALGWCVRTATTRLPAPAITSRRRYERSRPAATAMPPAMVPIEDRQEGRAFDRARCRRTARRCSSFSGRMPYLSGPNSEATMPNRPSANDQDRHRVQEEASRGKAGDGDLAEPDALGDDEPCRSGRPARRRVRRR